jgi:hypothetical protein
MMPLPAVKVGPPMRFRSSREAPRQHVDYLEDRAHEWLKGFLKPFTDACIYLPVDKQEYVVAAKELFLNADLPYPSGFHATNQSDACLCTPRLNIRPGDQESTFTGSLITSFHLEFLS